MIDISYDSEDGFVKITFEDKTSKIIRSDEAYTLRRRLLEELPYTPNELLIKKDMLRDEHLRGYQRAINILINNREYK